MKLKRIVEQQYAAAQYYDLGRDFSSFTRTMNFATEEVKARFEHAISSKLKGKKIRARASRGYKQFEKDYDIDVVGVSIDDYYDNYVVVAKGKNGKDYFLKPGFKVQVVGVAETDPPEQPAPAPQPEQPSVPSPQSKVPTAPQPKQPQRPSQSQQSVKEIGEKSPDTEIVKKYPVAQIEQDVTPWLYKLLANRRAKISDYIPRDGIYRKKGRKAVSVFGLTIPVEDVPGLTADLIKHELAGITKSIETGSVETLYVLDKFDVRHGKYVLVIKKVTNY